MRTLLAYGLLALLLFLALTGCIVTPYGYGYYNAPVIQPYPVYRPYGYGYYPSLYPYRSYHHHRPYRHHW